MERGMWRGLCHELGKLAALTPAEQELLRQAVRRQAAFDRLSYEGTLDAAGRAQMQANAERIKAFRRKSIGEASHVPGWAKDPGGVPPAASRWSESSAASRAVAARALRHAALGALAGGLGGLLADPEHLRAQAEQGGPILRFQAEHPALTGALVGGSAMGLAGAAKTLPGYLAGLVAPGMSLAALDRSLAYLERRKKAA
jgi:hypothetical protein